MITQPIDLGTVPTDGTEITASATGDLTLHGVTKSVTLDVTAQRNGDIIDVLGSTNVVFADYGTRQDARLSPSPICVHLRASAENLRNNLFSS